MGCYSSLKSLIRSVRSRSHLATGQTTKTIKHTPAFLVGAGSTIPAGQVRDEFKNMFTNLTQIFCFWLCACSHKNNCFILKRTPQILIKWAKSFPRWLYFWCDTNIGELLNPKFPTWGTNIMWDSVGKVVSFPPRLFIWVWVRGQRSKVTWYSPTTHEGEALRRLRWSVLCFSVS